MCNNNKNNTTTIFSDVQRFVKSVFDSPYFQYKQNMPSEISNWMYVNHDISNIGRHMILQNDYITTYAFISKEIKCNEYFSTYVLVQNKPALVFMLPEDVLYVEFDLTNIIEKMFTEIFYEINKRINVESLSILFEHAVYLYTVETLGILRCDDDSIVKLIEKYCGILNYDKKVFLDILSRDCDTLFDCGEYLKELNR